MDDDMQGNYWENQTEHMHKYSNDDGYSLPHDVQVYLEKYLPNFHYPITVDLYFS